MDYFYIHLFTELEKANFFKVKEKKVLMKQNIMNLFNRIEKLSITELQTLRGIISALTNRR
jgi:tRNA C32,U32 (ribose-2'-O)-methylase TrmJ